MNYSIAPEVFQMYPGYVRGVVVVAGLANGSAENPEIAALLRDAETEVNADDSLANVAEHPRIASWRAAYARFGVRPSKFFSSIEALVRRVRKGDQLPYINDLAAICNVFSLRHLVPVGGHDVGVIRHDLSLALATGDEIFMPIGAVAAENPDPGEVVYLAGDTVLCRRWTWRQADLSKLVPESTFVAINVDGMPPVSPELVARICDEMAEMVVRFCGGKVDCRYLTVDTPVISLDL